MHVSTFFEKHFSRILYTILLLAFVGGCKPNQDPATRTYVLRFGHLANEDHI
jgi:hypothetical protein